MRIDKRAAKFASSAKCLLLRLASPYDVANVFLDEIALALRKLGHDVAFLGGPALSYVEQLCLAARWEPDWVVSLNGVALDFNIDGIPLPQALGAQSLNVVIDNPHHFGHRWEKACPGLTTVVDVEVAAYLEARWPQLGQVIYLPHGACGPGSFNSQASRSIDLLFAGTYHCPERLRQGWMRYSPCMRDWLEDQAQQYLFNSQGSVWNAELLAHLQVLCNHESIRADLENYIRSRRRHHLLSTLTQSGFRVTLVGRGWESYPEVGYHHFIGAKSFSQLLELFGVSKMVLHSTTSLDSHERPLSAMLQGAVSLCDANPFFQSNFDQHLDLVTYMWENLSDLTDRIGQLSKDDEARSRMALSGQERVRTGHTWEVRLQKLPIVPCRR